MLSVSVSNLDLYRVWRGSEELEVEWLLRRLRGEEPQTEAMKAGQAFHKILQAPDFIEQTELTEGDFWFSIVCDIEVKLPALRELSIEKQYGDLLVRGRVDGLDGNRITDYKTTEKFDGDRLMEGYQWRFYLDMMDCETFLWKVFVLSQYGKPGHYDVIQSHELTQKRYPGLAEDCAKLAHEYLDFIYRIPEAQRPKSYAATAHGGHTKISRCWCPENLSTKCESCHGQNDHHGRFGARQKETA